MGNCKSSTETIILHNSTALLFTDCPKLCKAKGVTIMGGRHEMAADIFPGILDI